MLFVLKECDQTAVSFSTGFAKCSNSPGNLEGEKKTWQVEDMTSSDLPKKLSASDGQKIICLKNWGGKKPCLLSIWHNIHTLKWHHPLLAKFLWGLMRTEIFSCKAKIFSMLEFIKHGMTTMSIFFFFHSQRPPLGQKKSMWEVCQPQRWLWLGL